MLIESQIYELALSAEFVSEVTNGCLKVDDQLLLLNLSEKIKAHRLICNTEMLQQVARFNPKT